MQRKSFTSVIRNRFLFIIIFLAGYVLAEFIFSIALALIFKNFHINFESNINSLSVFILFLHMTWIVLYIDFFRRISGYELEKSRLISQSGRNIRLLVIGALYGGMLIALVQVLRYILGLVSEFRFWDLKSNIILILGSLLVTMFTVIIEEMAFRKTIFLMLRNYGTPFWISSGVTSIIFALLHFQRKIGLIDLVFFFLFSIILCTLVENYKSIWLGIGIHAGWNFLADGGNLYEIDFMDSTFSQMLTNKLISIVVVLLVILIYNKIVIKYFNNDIMMEG